ncbi:MAG TPA: tRNA lysidine(34) synthetase TilS [Vicinamibacterales bacterium]|nr:tRNA lysidine(34) synthetase TilS [Vicinamibacterales bacterium]
MSRILQQVRRTIRRYGLFPPGARVVIGLSGGADSVALTRLLLELSAHGGFRVVSLAHLNHRLRPSADRDERFCREFAARIELPIAAESADVAGYASSQRLSIEDAGRRLRYEFLERAAAAAGADRIAVGHTRDDQAETFLLKLLRGAGLTGLGGIYPQRGAVVRPLLDVARADVRAYLRSIGQPWVEDETNEDPANPRNRVRHVVLPALEGALGGQVTGAIARAAALAREDGLWLDELALRRFTELRRRRTDGVEFDAAVLRAEPPPVRRRILLQAMRERAEGREIGLEHVEAVQEVLSGVSAAAEVPGGRVELCGGMLVLIDQTTPAK